MTSRSSCWPSGPARRRALSAALLGAAAFWVAGCESAPPQDGPSAKASGIGLDSPLESVPVFTPGECRFAIAADLDIQCGTVDVPARRDLPDPAVLALAVTIFPAVDGVGARPPVFFLDGGPGEIAFFESTEGYDPLDDWLHIADAIGTDRDFILIEQRGVGFSEPDLDCPELEAVAETVVADRHAIIEAEVEAVEACRARLAQALEAAAITTPESAADVVAVAEALGAARFAIMGVSYGTRLGLEVMRLAPERIEAAVLDSVYPPSINWYEQGADLYRNAFETVFNACAADPSCHGVFPDIRDRFHQLTEAVRQDPVTVMLFDRATGQETTAVLIDDIELIEGLFLRLYDADMIAGLPSMLDIAADTEPAILAETIDYPYLGSKSSAEGQYLTIECAETVFSADEARVGAALAGQGPYARAAQAHWHQMRSICEAWGSLRAPKPEPVTAEVPTLILAGKFDPVTPVRWAQQTAERLPNATLVTFPGLSHSVMTSDACALKTARAFLERGSADEACLADRAPLSFVMDRQFLH